MDGLVTFGGVIVGSVAFNELFPVFQGLYASGNKGHIFLYDLMGLPAPVLALLVVLMAIALFMGAEKVEAWASKRAGIDAPERQVPQRRLAFATVSGLAVVGLVGLALPAASTAKAANEPADVTAAELARRVLDEPWAVRVLDVRDHDACAAQRVPGAECTPLETVSELGLPFAPGARDLVIVSDGALEQLPADVLGYKGRVLVLDGGFDAWKAFALTAPEPLPTNAAPADREAWAFRSGVVAAMTGVKQAPPAAAPTAAFQPKKKKGGGCN
jgi:rhodanese-related sulfurtransferase